jgi:hypothetical protein
MWEVEVAVCSFLTLALDGGAWSISWANRCILRKEPVPLEWEAEWAPEVSWMFKE